MLDGTEHDGILGPVGRCRPELQTLTTPRCPDYWRRYSRVAPRPSDKDNKDRWEENAMSLTIEYIHSGALDVVPER